ncbi:MAG TPA: ABC transporter ATP-binding protein [Vicinamibacteria bacterium]|nr:ABC transporter ATP-binding protein [Vicinamibacteria bacterium]
MSFEIGEGERLGLVGESGSGKTTIGRLLLRLETADGGDILVRGREISGLRGKDARAFYRDVQMVFQDPYGSLNPRFKVQDTLMDPVIVQRLAPRRGGADRAAWALERAGLSPPEEFFHKYPHELSGGQRQRVAIARALVMNPRVLVADEPVSMLDVSIKAGILNLLKKLSDEDGVAILYISHDLSTVKYLCHRTAILYRGKLVEVGPTGEVIERPRHPYSQALKAAVPNPDPRAPRRQVAMTGNPGERVKDLGCRFRHRCPDAMEVCAHVEPALIEVGRNHFVACHLHDPNI